MLPILAFTFTGLGIGLAIAIWGYHYDDPSNDTLLGKIFSLVFLTVFLGLVGSILGLCCGIVTSSTISSIIDKPRKEIAKVAYIYPLKDNRDVESESTGTFILGTSMVHTKTGVEIYYYAMVEKDGGLMMDRWHISTVIKRETDKRRPAFRKYYWIPDKDKMTKSWTLGSDPVIWAGKYDVLTLWAYYREKSSRGEVDGYHFGYLDVPIGTVTRDFTINPE